MNQQDQQNKKNIFPVMIFGVLIAVISIVGGLLTWQHFRLGVEVEEKPPVEELVNFSALIDIALYKATYESSRALGYIKIKDFQTARKVLDKSELYMLDANRYFQEGKDILTEIDRAKYKIIFEFYNDSGELFIRGFYWRQAIIELGEKEIIDRENALLILPKMETFVKDGRKLMDDMYKFIIEFDYVIGTNFAVKKWYEEWIKKWGPKLEVETIEEYIDLTKRSIITTRDAISVYEEEIQNIIIYFDL